MTARFLPFLIFWRAALFFLVQPTAMLLDWWLGIEGISYLRERDVRSLVARAAASGGDIGKLEALGVQNFLDLDDLSVTEEGEPVDPQSIISLPLANERCVLPASPTRQHSVCVSLMTSQDLSTADLCKMQREFEWPE